MLLLVSVTACSFFFFVSFVVPVLPSVSVTVVYGASGLCFTLALVPATTADAHP
jgi:hypothetical protein